MKFASFFLVAAVSRWDICVLAMLPALPVAAAPPHPDHLWRLVGPAAFAAGERAGLEIDEKAGGLRLAAAGPRSGTYISPVREAAPFNEAVPSWSAECPPGARVTVALRVRVGGAWQEWADIAEWGAADARTLKPVVRDLTSTDVDTLKVNGGRTADALQLRATLAAEKAGSSPVLRALSAVHYMAGDALPCGTARSAAWGHAIDVPPRSQLVEDAKIRGAICSPTSLSMVLEHYGVKRPTAAVAAGVLDHGADLYGTWPFNTAYAAAVDRSKIADAWVGKLCSMEELEAEIAAGRPVVATLRWKKGELEGSPNAWSDGHLLVALGFTNDGDVVVNDPAANPAKSEPVRRTYKRRDFHRAWLEHGQGIVYAIRAR